MLCSIYITYSHVYGLRWDVTRVFDFRVFDCYFFLKLTNLLTPEKEQNKAADANGCVPQKFIGCLSLAHLHYCNARWKISLTLYQRPLPLAGRDCTDVRYRKPYSMPQCRLLTVSYVFCYFHHASVILFFFAITVLHVEQPALSCCFSTRSSLIDCKLVSLLVYWHPRSTLIVATTRNCPTETTRRKGSSGPPRFHQAIVGDGSGHKVRNIFFTRFGGHDNFCAYTVHVRCLFCGHFLRLARKNICLIVLVYMSTPGGVVSGSEAP